MFSGLWVSFPNSIRQNSIHQSRRCPHVHIYQRKRREGEGGEGQYKGTYELRMSDFIPLFCLFLFWVSFLKIIFSHIIRLHSWISQLSLFTQTCRRHSSIFFSFYFVFVLGLRFLSFIPQLFKGSRRIVMHTRFLIALHFLSIVV